ncbi:ligase-associated DNA damage response exonuclease [Fimbriimonas ginsengisoli]|uniref:RNA procession exonuclease-like protein n=1 Tax=Fimbriimonas ginsengisoli Gsoil 348 TaxID=661478 RepID=A0A068NUT3_FIMGI|nr:ligase-associated DNA damage response exonuclease [Fimbriimonas ginsengisoli]AIE87097.1 RNA procession exonuclease-like protein [Fimbriimonas ginsengisoli Gsoil 348]
MARRRKELLCLTDRGLYCHEGDFYVDPWKPVDRAVVTHAHSDHARWGMKRYLCTKEGERVLRRRVGEDAAIDTLAYGEPVTLNGVRVSLHPAGHILGSAQVRVEHGGRVYVVSGDYKTEMDSTCTPFEPVPCHTFITESTFGLPIYRWPAQAEVIEQIHGWWKGNQAAGKCSILLGYALGKCQRALAYLNPEIGPIFLHGAVQGLTNDYREEGIALPPTHLVPEVGKGFDWSQAIVLAPPSANGSPWVRRFGDHSTGFMSGWMAIRGARRRRAVDRGFVVSDHVDWPSLIGAIAQTGAESVWVTHGYSSVVVRYLEEQGLDAHALSTRWEGEQDEGAEAAEAVEQTEGERPYTPNTEGKLE